MSNTIKGFLTKDGTALYDFSALANVPEVLQEIPAARVGQYLVVGAVDENGTISKVKATTAPAGGASVFYWNFDTGISEDTLFYNVSDQDISGVSTNGRTLQAGDLLITNDGVLLQVTEVVSEPSGDKFGADMCAMLGGASYVLTEEDKREIAGMVAVSNGGGLTSEQISSLNEMFKIASFTADPSGAYAAFCAAFGIEGSEVPGDPAVTLTSISAAYSGGDVPVGTAVTALTGIVVTAHYSDGSTANVTAYTLSGTIAEGSNTITVSYGGMTAAFAVTGVAESGGENGWNVKDVSWEDGDGITLTADDILYGYSLDNIKPNATPPQTVGSRTDRASYPHFDIPIEYGYKYKFEFESTASAAQIGLQFYNEYALANYGTGSISGCIYDPGWQSNGVEIEPPEMQNDSPIVGVRLTWRKDTGNSPVDEGMITGVTITRTEVA